MNGWMMPNLNIDIDMRRDQSRGEMLSCTKMTALKIDKINIEPDSGGPGHLQSSKVEIKPNPFV